MTSVVATADCLETCFVRYRTGIKRACIADIDTSRNDVILPQDVVSQLYQESGVEVDAICG